MALYIYAPTLPKILEISQKINELEIPYKLKNQENENIAILGFGR